MSDTPAEESGVLREQILYACGLYAHDNEPLVTLPEAALHSWAAEVERKDERIRKLEHESAELILASDALILDLRERTGQRDRLAQANKELLEALQEMLMVSRLPDRDKARAAISKHGGTK